MKKKLIIILIIILILITIAGIYFFKKGNINLSDTSYWDESKKVNTPIVLEGMTPVVYEEDGKIIKLNNDKIMENNWYEYVIQQAETTNLSTSKHNIKRFK